MAQPKKETTKSAAQIEAMARKLTESCDPTKIQIMAVLMKPNDEAHFLLKGNIENLFTALLACIRDSPELTARLEHFYNS